jgi:hypothetical protein
VSSPSSSSKRIRRQPGDPTADGGALSDNRADHDHDGRSDVPVVSLADAMGDHHRGTPRGGDNNDLDPETKRTMATAARRLAPNFQLPPFTHHLHHHLQQHNHRDPNQVPVSFASLTNAIPSSAGGASSHLSDSTAPTLDFNIGALDFPGFDLNALQAAVGAAQSATSGHQQQHEGSNGMDLMLDPELARL